MSRRAKPVVKDVDRLSHVLTVGIQNPTTAPKPVTEPEPVKIEPPAAPAEPVSATVEECESVELKVESED
jgi:hypothetical protein